MRRTILSLITVAALAAISLHAGTQTRPAQNSPEKGKDATLFDKLGGMPGVTALVDDFVNRVTADSRINAFFSKADLTRFRKQFGDQLCHVAGGPCTYQGQDMLSVHKGMRIGGDHFQAMMEDLMAALRHAGASPEVEGALVGKLLPMKPDIVEKP